MAYLGQSGGTGQVLTVSVGAPVWAASSPTTLWEADLTTGQTAGAWSVPSSSNTIAGISGYGSINWSATVQSGTAWSVAIVNGSGLEFTAPASPGVLSQLGIFTSLDALGLSYFSGRPFRIWTQSARSGGISSGGNFTEVWGTVFGDPFVNSCEPARGFTSTGNSGVSTFGFGTDRSAAPGSPIWYSSDVFCLTCAPGCLTVGYGTYSGGWPSSKDLYTFNSGAIQTSKLPNVNTVVGPPAQPYTEQGRFAFLPYVQPGSYTNRKWIIQRIKIEGL